MTQREYRAYLLRIWRESPSSSWRALLENPHSGERSGFASLAELVRYVEEITGEPLLTRVTDEASSAAEKNS